jgi:uncharacterized protein
VTFADLPRSAAWRHEGARAGFEVAFFSDSRPPLRISGSTIAVEAGAAWAVDYEIELDALWRTTTARIAGRSAGGLQRRVLEADGNGHWLIDRVAVDELDGCLDVDLESSVVTNLIPVHREALPVGGEAAAPAAYMRAGDLVIERLEQSYRRLSDDGRNQCFDYRSPTFDFRERLVYDSAGLVLDYPGLAVRVR